MGDDGETVTGRDKGVGAIDHVAITVAIAGGTEMDAVFIDGGNKRVCVDEIGIRVSAAKIRRWDAILGAARRQREFLFEDGNAIRTGDAVESIEEDFEVFVGGEEVFDHRKVEDVFQHFDVVGDRVDDFHFEGAIGLGANGGHVNVRNVGDLVFRERFGGREDFVGDGFWCRGAIGEVVLDTKVLVRSCRYLVSKWKRSSNMELSITTGIMTGSQQNATGGTAFSDNMAGSGGGEDAILPDQ